MAEAIALVALFRVHIMWMALPMRDAPRLSGSQPHHRLLGCGLDEWHDMRIGLRVDVLMRNDFKPACIQASETLSTYAST